MFKEHNQIGVDLFSSCVICCCYRDNIYLFGPPKSVSPSLQALQKTLTDMYVIPVQLEGQGHSLDLLECRIQSLPDSLSVTLRPKALSPFASVLTDIRRWPDACWFNCDYTLRSLIPGLASKTLLCHERSLARG